MPTPPYAPEVAVWTDDAHAQTVERLLDLMGQAVHPIAVGGPPTSGSEQLADKLDAKHYDDLRLMGIERPAAFLLLAVNEDAPPADLAAALGSGTTVLTLEPACATLAGYTELQRPTRNADDANATLPGRCILLPRFTLTPGYLAAAQPQDTLGDRRSVLITSVGPARDASLFTRLHDGWSTALSFCETPELVHATLAHQNESPPEGPRHLAGRIAVNATCPAGSSITLLAADNSPTLPRTLAVLGDTGQLTLTPTGYHLKNAQGETVDQLEPASANVPPTLDQMADQWRRLIDQRGPATPADAPGTRRDQQALACTLAALLSAKTGQPESPQRVMQMSKG